MNKPLPQRPPAHVLGEKAVEIFVNGCPSNWIIAPLQPDYGLDLRVELVRGTSVSGEEFVVQVKGRNKIYPTPQGAAKVKIKHSTINYWLGKINPTMIVCVDIQKNRIYYSWLEHAYKEYPKPLETDGNLELHLAIIAGADFPDVVTGYVSDYFSRLRVEINLGTDRVHLSRMLLHVSALTRCLTQIHLMLTSGLPMEKLKDPLNHMFLEFGLHDRFLHELRSIDSAWNFPLSSKTNNIVTKRVDGYVRLRGKFYMQEKRVTHGDLVFVPFSYSHLKQYLIPALEAAWDLQEALNELVVLGATVSDGDNGA
jgi:hypothetical protein